MRKWAWGVVAVVLLAVGVVALGRLAAAIRKDRAAEQQRIAAAYGLLVDEGRRPAREFDRYELPADGAETCLRAIRASGRKDRLLIRLTDEYTVLVFREFYPGHDEHDWVFAPYVLRLTPPSVDLSDGVSAEEAARLHCHYVSLWITQHLDDRRVTEPLFFGINFRREAEGAWLVDSGLGQIAGDSIQSYIGADGRLKETRLYFSPR